MWTVSVVIAVAMVAVMSVIALLRSQRSKDNHDSILKQKFAVKDGITFYDNSVSPCARRVRTAFYEKGIKHRVIDVNLMTRENCHPSFLAINPLGKVPAVVVHNVEGIHDCCLFESNAITEWLDEQFPNTVQLYPSDPWERAQVKMWQRWEAAMTEDFWPMMYSNVSGFISRAMYSRSTYQRKLASGDPYQAAKMMKTYDGILLSEKEKKDTAVRLFRWLDLLESALVGKQYLCGDSFTMADVSVLPRVVLFPLIGFLTTDKERCRYPNLIRYMKALASRKSIIDADRSNTMLRMNKWIPWSVVEWIGNWRSGQHHHRMYGEDVLPELEASIHVHGQPMATEPSSKGSNILLYHHTLWPASIMTRITCLELGIRAEIKEVNMLHLEHRSSGFLAFNPNGEVPTACHDGRVIYDPLNVIEYLSTIFADLTVMTLLPDDPIDRVHMRMWHGWMNTCFNYQFIHLYKQHIVASILKSQFTSEESLLQVLHKSTTAQEYVNSLVDIFKSDTASEEIESKLSPYKLGLENALQYLDRELSCREYLVGSKLSAADVSVFSMVMFFKWVGLSISGGKYASVAAWMERMTSVPSISVVLNEVEDCMLSHGLQNKC